MIRRGRSRMKKTHEKMLQGFAGAPAFRTLQDLDGSECPFDNRPGLSIEDDLRFCRLHL